MRLPISPRITKPSSEESTYQHRQNNKSRVNTIRLSYEKNNQISSVRRLSGDGSSMSNNTNSNRRFVPNVNSPTWRSIQGVMKSKIASPRHYASSPRHSTLAKYKMGSPSPRGRGGSGFFGAKVSTQQLVGGGGGVDSYSLTAASTNSVDELEMKFSGGSSLDDDDENCNKIDNCNTEARDDEVVVDGHKIFGYNGKDTNGDLNACPSSDTSTSSLIYSMNDSFDINSSNGVSNVGKLLPSLSLDDEDDEYEYDESLNNMTNDIDKLVRDADKQLTNFNEGKNNEKTYLSSSREDDDEEEGSSRDTEAADLVANTLAECRLLLDMSPPPTPVGYQEEMLRQVQEKRDTACEEKKKEVPPPMQSDKIKAVRYPKQQQEEATVEDPPAHQPRRSSQQEISDVSISKTSSINNNSMPSLSSIAKFLTCPTCNQEFGEEFENATPLHSFACDHIICRGCVFANNAVSKNSNEGGSTAVACPDCGEENAFDTCRPVVSRAYLNLITKMKSVGSIKSSSVNDDDDDMKERRGVRSDNNTGRIGDRRGGGKVPTQISVPLPRVDRQAIQERTGETRGGEETASLGTSSIVSNDFSKSSLTLSTTRRLHKPLPTLAIETGEQSAPSIPTLEVISSTPKAKVSSATTDMTKEPITPVSRAEYRFLQRKEKLAQSLEKVNRILERSKANKQQVENQLVQHSQEKVSVYHQNMALTQVQEDENMMRDMAPGYHKVEVRQAPPSRLEQQKQPSITGRRNVELRVDTGPKSTTALQARRSKKAEELDVNAYPVQNDTVDIFRTTNYDDTAPQLIEFGTHFIGQTFSNGSSLTDMDTLFLLGGGKKSPATCTASVQSNNKFSSPFKKDRLNNIMKSSPMKSRGHLNSIMKSSRSSQSLSNMDNDDQQEQEPDVCPQFLPSLTYATMDDECNEVAGLIAMSPHNKDYNEPPQPMWGVGSRSVASADQCGSVLTSMVLQNEKEQEAPTYDFVSHSCSMSPSSYYDDDNKQTSQFSGSGLVTHKPKTLHKKLLNTFRRGAKKKTMR